MIMGCFPLFISCNNETEEETFEESVEVVDEGDTYEQVEAEDQTTEDSL